MTTIQKLFTTLDSDLLSSVERGRGLRFTSEEWKLDGVCRTVDPDLWFPEGQTADAAKALCETCPVIQRCLLHALVCNEKYGVWGGKTQRERAVLRRKLGWTRPVPDSFRRNEKEIS